MIAVAMMEAGLTRKPAMQPAIAAAMAAMMIVCGVNAPPWKLIAAKNTNTPTMSETQIFSAVSATSDRRRPVKNGKIMVMISLPAYHSDGTLRPRL